MIMILQQTVEYNKLEFFIGKDVKDYAFGDNGRGVRYRFRSNSRWSSRGNDLADLLLALGLERVTPFRLYITLEGEE